MIKRFYLTTLLSMLVLSMFGQKVSTFQDSIGTYFEEVKVATSRYHQTWGKDLYGPMLLVNPVTRQVFANHADTLGILKQDGKIYSGFLPNDINIANTSCEWNGRDWAMIMLPLPDDKKDRINLLAHELFHVSQPILGFKLFNTENNHLDQKDGRTYLRLELEALKEVAQATNKKKQQRHLINALTFRKYRHSLYTAARSNENSLELNEGIAEYTGMVTSGRNKKQAAEHFVKSINSFLGNPTFVRSFAYQTIPFYGYLLDNSRKGWNREITIETNLTDYFIKAFGISIPDDLKETTDLILNQYNGEEIISEEKTREERTKKLIAEYKNKFITQPHFELVFEKMSVSFDPGNLMPLESDGTVYPNIRVSDKWGILTVKNGALMSPNWDKITITIPLKIEDNNINGDGWTLELNADYLITKDEVTGNYKLFKKLGGK